MSKPAGQPKLNLDPIRRARDLANESPSQPASSRSKGKSTMAMKMDKLFEQHKSEK